MEKTLVSCSTTLNSGQQMCQGFSFPITKEFSDSPDTSWVSYNLTQVCDCLPGVDIRRDRGRAQSHNPTPTSDANHTSGSPLCFRTGHWRSLYLLLAFCHLLKELRKTAYSWNYGFIVKGDNSGLARCTEQGVWWRVQSLRALPEQPRTPNLCILTNLGALWTLSFWAFMAALIGRRGWLRHWSSVINSAGDCKMERKFPPSHHMVLSSGRWTPSCALQGLSKNHLVNTVSVVVKRSWLWITKNSPLAFVALTT